MTLTPLGLPDDDEEIILPSTSSKPLPIRINDDRFLFARKLPVGLMSTALNLRGMGVQNLEPFWEFFDKVAVNDSVALLRKRSTDPGNPIDHRDVMALLNTLIERWGLRPSEPSPKSSSSSGDGTSGTTSTAGASPADSDPSATSPALVLSPQPSSATSPTTT